MSWHLIWLWFWFLIGSALYMLKRAYFLVTGPNPIANSYRQFIERCWIPLLVRLVIDSGFFWACFTPELATAGLNYLGWAKFGWVVSVVTQFAVASLFFGFDIDSIVDFGINKIPWLKGWLPQMPGPLPTLAPTDKQAAAMLAGNQRSNN
jgi:hypothetical protein